MPGSHYLSDVICAAVVGFCSLSFARVLPSIATRRGTLAASIPGFPCGGSAGRRGFTCEILRYDRTKLPIHYAIISIS